MNWFDLFERQRTRRIRVDRVRQKGDLRPRREGLMGRIAAAEQNPVFNYRRALSANCSVSALESSLRKDDGLDRIRVRSQTQRPHTRRRTVNRAVSSVNVSLILLSTSVKMPWLLFIILPPHCMRRPRELCVSLLLSARRLSPSPLESLIHSY